MIGARVRLVGARARTNMADHPLSLGVLADDIQKMIYEVIRKGEAWQKPERIIKYDTKFML